VNKVLTIDPSGIGTTGIFICNNSKDLEKAEQVQAENYLFSEFKSDK